MSFRKVSVWKKENLYSKCIGILNTTLAGKIKVCYYNHTTTASSNWISLEAVVI